jgi:hypothetical protein
MQQTGRRGGTLRSRAERNGDERNVELCGRTHDRLQLMRISLGNSTELAGAAEGTEGCDGVAKALDPVGPNHGLAGLW